MFHRKRELQHEPAGLSAALSLFNSFRVISPTLHRQDDEEEDDESEVMSDHMKDTEVRRDLYIPTADLWLSMTFCWFLLNVGAQQ